MSRSELMQWTEDDRTKILAQYHKTPNGMAADVEHIKEWMKNQPHLPEVPRKPFTIKKMCFIVDVLQRMPLWKNLYWLTIAMWQKQKRNLWIIMWRRVVFRNFSPDTQRVQRWWRRIDFGWCFAFFLWHYKFFCLQPRHCTTKTVQSQQIRRF